MHFDWAYPVGYRSIGCGADAVFATNLGNRHSGFSLSQYGDYLTLGKFRLLHLLFLKRAEVSIIYMCTFRGSLRKDSSFDEKDIYVVTYSLIGIGSFEAEATGPEQARQSVQIMPLEILIAKADFKHGLLVHEITE